MPQFVSFVCGSCRKSYKTTPLFRRHKCKRNQPQCDRCGKVFGAKKTLATHIETHRIKDKEERQKAKERRRRINPAQRLKDALKQLKREGRKIKERQILKFKAAKRLKAARKLLKREELQRQKRQIQKFNAANPMKSTRKRKVLICDGCGADFKRTQGLAKHVTRGSDRICVYCKEKLVDACRLYLHTQSDHFHKLWTCDHCSKQFNRRVVMVKHIRETHLKIIRFRCEQCWAGFYRSDKYNAHMKEVHWHSQEFICDLCDLLCWSKNYILKHSRARHKNPP